MTAQPQGQPEEPRPERTNKHGLRPIFTPVPREEMSVHWGPVFAGVLIALGVNLVVYILGLALSLSAAAPGGGGLAGGVLRSAGLWSGLGWLVALFVGGLVAGRLGAYQGLRRGLLQGTTVWAVYLLIWLSISSSGVAGALGAASAIVTPGGLGAAAPGGGRLLSAAASAAWWLLAAMVLGWVAAIIGGYVGARAKKMSESRPERDRNR